MRVGCCIRSLTLLVLSKLKINPTRIISDSFSCSASGPEYSLIHSSSVADMLQSLQSIHHKISIQRITIVAAV
ncbi:hypothetical protein QL285_061642 [Trifolium repens]|nr:hypothetical protein QL285_061642 [Trifolium repens]